MRRLLRLFPTLGINEPEIIRTYAAISAWTEGNQIEGIKFPPPKPAVTMGQNDIWVAATAHATKSLLLSTDKDFIHLNKTWIEFAFVTQTRSQQGG